MKDNSLDPISCFELYISKLYLENNSLFPKPSKHFAINENVSFRKEVLGKNTIPGIMKSMS